MTGTGGIVPGDRPVVVEVALPVPGRHRLAVTALEPDLASLPPSCPAALWHLAPARTSLSGGPDARLAVAVELAAQAPSDCQGLAAVVPVGVTLRPATGTPLRLVAAVPLAVARLGAPDTTVRAEGDQLVVQGAAAPAGPAPTAFTVDAVAPDGTRRPVCRAHTLQACVDSTATPATPLRYELTAWRGAWRAAAAAVTAWAPPPAPRVELPGGPRARVRAARAGGDWTLRISVDGRPTTSLTVRAGATLDGDLPLGDLPPGTHRVQAVATAHGQERAAEETLTILDGAAAG